MVLKFVLAIPLVVEKSSAKSGEKSEKIT